MFHAKITAYIFYLIKTGGSGGKNSRVVNNRCDFNFGDDSFFCIESSTGVERDFCYVNRFYAFGFTILDTYISHGMVDDCFRISVDFPN